MPLHKKKKRPRTMVHHLIFPDEDEPNIQDFSTSDGPKSPEIEKQISSDSSDLEFCSLTPTPTYGQLERKNKQKRPSDSLKPHIKISSQDITGNRRTEYPSNVTREPQPSTSGYQGNGVTNQNQVISLISSDSDTDNGLSYSQKQPARRKTPVKYNKLHKNIFEQTKANLAAESGSGSGQTTCTSASSPTHKKIKKSRVRRQSELETDDSPTSSPVKEGRWSSLSKASQPASNLAVNPSRPYIHRKRLTENSDTDQWSPLIRKKKVSRLKQTSSDDSTEDNQSEGIECEDIPDIVINETDDDETQDPNRTLVVSETSSEEAMQTSDKDEAPQTKAGEADKLILNQLPAKNRVEVAQKSDVYNYEESSSDDGEWLIKPTQISSSSSSRGRGGNASRGYGGDKPSSHRKTAGIYSTEPVKSATSSPGRVTSSTPPDDVFSVSQKYQSHKRLQREDEEKEDSSESDEFVPSTGIFSRVRTNFNQSNICSPRKRLKTGLPGNSYGVVLHHESDTDPFSMSDDGLPSFPEKKLGQIATKSSAQKACPKIANEQTTTKEPQKEVLLGKRKWSTSSEEIVTEKEKRSSAQNITPEPKPSGRPEKEVGSDLSGGIVIKKECIDQQEQLANFSFTQHQEIYVIDSDDDDEEVFGAFTQTFIELPVDEPEENEKEKCESDEDEVSTLDPWEPNDMIESILGEPVSVKKEAVDADRSAYLTQKAVQDALNAWSDDEYPWQDDPANVLVPDTCIDMDKKLENWPDLHYNDLDDDEFIKHITTIEETQLSNEGADNQSPTKEAMEIDEYKKDLIRDDEERHDDMLKNKKDKDIAKMPGVESRKELGQHKAQFTESEKFTVLHSPKRAGTVEEDRQVQYVPVDLDLSDVQEPVEISKNKDLKIQDGAISGTEAGKEHQDGEMSQKDIENEELSALEDPALLTQLFVDEPMSITISDEEDASDYVKADNTESGGGSRKVDLAGQEDSAFANVTKKTNGDYPTQAASGTYVTSVDEDSKARSKSDVNLIPQKKNIKMENVPKKLNSSPVEEEGKDKNVVQSRTFMSAFLDQVIETRKKSPHTEQSIDLTITPPPPRPKRLSLSAKKLSKKKEEKESEVITAISFDKTMRDMSDEELARFLSKKYCEESPVKNVPPSPQTIIKPDKPNIAYVDLTKELSMEACSNIAQRLVKGMRDKLTPPRQEVQNSTTSATVMETDENSVQLKGLSSSKRPSLSMVDSAKRQLSEGKDSGVVSASKHTGDHKDSLTKAKPDLSTHKDSLKDSVSAMKDLTSDKSSAIKDSSKATSLKDSIKDRSSTKEDSSKHKASKESSKDHASAIKDHSKDKSSTKHSSKDKSSKDKSSKDKSSTVKDSSKDETSKDKSSIKPSSKEKSSTSKESSKDKTSKDKSSTSKESSKDRSSTKHSSKDKSSKDSSKDKPSTTKDISKDQSHKDSSRHSSKDKHSKARSASSSKHDSKTGVSKSSSTKSSKSSTDRPHSSKSKRASPSNQTTKTKEPSSVAKVSTNGKDNVKEKVSEWKSVSAQKSSEKGVREGLQASAAPVKDSSKDLGTGSSTAAVTHNADTTEKAESAKGAALSRAAAKFQERMKKKQMDEMVVSAKVKSKRKNRSSRNETHGLTSMTQSITSAKEDMYDRMRRARKEKEKAKEKEAQKAKEAKIKAEEEAKKKAARIAEAKAKAEEDNVRLQKAAKEAEERNRERSNKENQATNKDPVVTSTISDLRAIFSQSQTPTTAQPLTTSNIQKQAASNDAPDYLKDGPLQLLDDLPEMPVNNIGKVVTTDDLLFIILQWIPTWLEEMRQQVDGKEMPPILKMAVPWLLPSETLWPVPDVFDTTKEYIEIMMGHVIHETWASIFSDWKRERGNRKISLVPVQRIPEDGVRFHSFVFQGLIQKNSRFPLREGDLVIVYLIVTKNRQSAGGLLPVFGYVEETKNYQPRNPNEIHAKLGRLDDIYRNRQMAFTAKIRMHYKLICPDMEFTNIEVVSSLTSVLRQINALVAFQRNLLCRHLIQPTTPRIFTSTEKALDQELMSLHNPSQVRAIQAVSEALLQPYVFSKVCLIQGPPGTGKSHTILSIIRETIFKKTVDGKNPCLLLCAPSNAAIDELVRRITLENAIREEREVDTIRLVRIGAFDSINESSKQYTLDNKVSEAWANKRLKMMCANMPMSVKREMIEIHNRLPKLQKSLIDAQRKDLKAEIKKIEEEIKTLETKRSKLDKTSQKEPSVREKMQLRMEVLAHAHVVCSTLNSAGSKVLLESFQLSQNQVPNPNAKVTRLQFTGVLIDEACQSVEVESLIPLQYGSSKLVLIGDPQQLPPTVISQHAETMKFSQSLFERLFNHFRSTSLNPVFMLDTQYRMHPEVVTFPSQLVYDGRLKTDPSVTQKRSLFPYKHYILFDLLYGREQSDLRTQSIGNPDEVYFILSLVKCLTQTKKIKQQVIGIITPYKKQVYMLNNQLRNCQLDQITVGTVDGFQGQEKDVIIVSCVRANSSNNRIGFVADKRRLNVALTRAKYACYVVGRLDTLRVDENWSKLVQDGRRRRSVISVRNACEKEAVIGRTIYKAMPVNMAPAGIPGNAPKSNTRPSS